MVVHTTVAAYLGPTLGTFPGDPCVIATLRAVIEALLQRCSAEAAELPGLFRCGRSELRGLRQGGSFRLVLDSRTRGFPRWSGGWA